MSLFKKSYRTVGAAEARQEIAAGALLVDVRSASEWKSGHAVGAKNLPLDTLGSTMATLPAGANIVTICHTGMRSAVAARTLAKHGFTVSNVRGGMIAWGNR
ncbi:rhodanese-like domain-containing protein [soil metagenome]